MDDLVTPRLRLRELSIDDAPALAELFRDPEVTRFHNLGPVTDLGEAEEAISRVRAGTEAGHMLRWAITVPPIDLAIGTVGFLDITPADRRADRSMRLLRTLGFAEEGQLRDYAFFKQRFNTLTRFSLLATDRSQVRSRE